MDITQEQRRFSSTMLWRWTLAIVRGPVIPQVLTYDSKPSKRILRMSTMGCGDPNMSILPWKFSKNAKKMYMDFYTFFHVFSSADFKNFRKTCFRGNHREISLESHSPDTQPKVSEPQTNSFNTTMANVSIQLV